MIVYQSTLPSWKADDVVLAESFKLPLTVTLKLGILSTLMVSQNIEVLFSNWTDNESQKYKYYKE